MKRDEVRTWIVRDLKMQNCIARILAFYSTITKIVTICYWFFSYYHTVFGSKITLLKQTYHRCGLLIYLSSSPN